MPPSLLAAALLLQTYDKVSGAEAKARAHFDIRWKVALGIEDRPFAKSTLQMFQAQLILHNKVREVFENSLRLARQSGRTATARWPSPYPSPRTAMPTGRSAPTTAGCCPTGWN